MTTPFLSLDLAVAPNPPSLISNLKLVTIPIDAYTCFELWTPSSRTSKLMPEEVLLLKDDYLRLEEICGKLMWLLGGKLTSGGTVCSQEPIYDWHSLVKFLRQARKRFDAIVVDYAPPKVCSIATEDSGVQAWTMNPSTWTISFLEFVLLKQSYEVKTLPMTVVITSGEPAIRHIKATPVGMQYL